MILAAAGMLVSNEFQSAVNDAAVIGQTQQNAFHLILPVLVSVGIALWVLDNMAGGNMPVVRDCPGEDGEVPYDPEAIHDARSFDVDGVDIVGDLASYGATSEDTWDGSVSYEPMDVHSYETFETHGGGVFGDLNGGDEDGDEDDEDDED